MEQQSAGLIIWPVVFSVFIAMLLALIAWRLVAWMLFRGQSKKMGKLLDKYMIQLGQMLGMDAKGNDITKPPKPN